MKLKLFCTYDSKTEAWLAPAAARHKGEILRHLEDACNNPEHPYCKYPLDYAFFEVGEFDDSNGQITTHETKIPLAQAIELKKVTLEPVPEPIKQMQRQLQ